MKDRTPIYLLIIILVGLTLRIYNLGKFGLWFDEALLCFIAKTSPPVSLFSLGLIESMRGFFVFFLKGWISISSNDSFLRFFSVMCGILSIGMIYHLGKFIFSRKIGILSALLLSISPLHIYYSQELTCYSLSVFLALSSSYYFLNFLKNPSCLSSILYTLTTLGFIHIHPINSIFILIQNIFFCLFYYKDKHLQKKWMYLQLIIFFLSLPWLGMVVSRFLRFSQLNLFFWIPKPDLGMVLQTFMVFSLGYYISWKLQLVALIIFLSLSSKAIFYWHKINGVFYLIFWLVVPVSLIWVISQSHPFYLHRVFLFTLPAFCLLTAAGMVKIKRYLTVGIIGLYLILVTCSLKNYYENKLPYDDKTKYIGVSPTKYIGVSPKKDYKKAASYVAENFREGDIILHICRSSHLPFIYYHQGSLPEYGIKLKNIYKVDWYLVSQKLFREYPRLIKIKANFTLLSKPLNIEKRDDLYKYKRIWLIHSSWEFQGRICLPNNDGVGKEIVGWFDKNFLREEIHMFDGINVYLFSSHRRVQ